MCRKGFLSKDFSPFIWEFVTDCNGGGFRAPPLWNLVYSGCLQKTCCIFGFHTQHPRVTCLESSLCSLVSDANPSRWYTGPYGQMIRKLEHGLKFSWSPKGKLRTLFPTHRSGELVQDPTAYQQLLPLAFHLFCLVASQQWLSYTWGQVSLLRAHKVTYSGGLLPFRQSPLFEDVLNGNKPWKPSTTLGGGIRNSKSRVCSFSSFWGRLSSMISFFPNWRRLYE